LQFSCQNPKIILLTKLREKLSQINHSFYHADYQEKRGEKRPSDSACLPPERKTKMQSLIQGSLSCISAVLSRHHSEIHDKESFLHCLKDLDAETSHLTSITDEIFHLVKRQFPYPFTDSIREVISNARDAQARKGNEEDPVLVDLSRYEIRVRDRGDGFDYFKLARFFVPNLSGDSLMQPSPLLVTGRFGQGRFAPLYYIMTENISPIKLNPNKNRITAFYLNENKQLFKAVLTLEGGVREKEIPAASISLHTKSRESSLHIQFTENQGQFWVDVSEREKEDEGTDFTISSPLISKARRKEIEREIQKSFAFNKTPLLLNGEKVHCPMQSASSLANSAISASSLTSPMDLDHSKLRFDGGTLFFSPYEEHTVGRLIIAEKGIFIREFPTLGCVPRNLVVNFDELPLSPERSSISLTDSETQAKVKALLSVILNCEHLNEQEKACLLNGLHYLFTSYNMEIQWPFCQNLCLPDTEDVKKLNSSHTAVYLHPSYSFSIHLDPCITSMAKIYFIDSPSPSAYAIAKIKQTPYLFINKRLINNKLFTQFNLGLIIKLFKIQQKTPLFDSKNLVSSLFPAKQKIKSLPPISGLPDPEVLEKDPDANEPVEDGMPQQLMQSCSKGGVFSEERLVSHVAFILAVNRPRPPRKLMRYMIPFADRVFPKYSWEILKFLGRLYYLVRLPNLRTDIFALILQDAIEHFNQFSREYSEYAEFLGDIFDEIYFKRMNNEQAYAFFKQSLIRLREAVLLLNSSRLPLKDYQKFIKKFITRHNSLELLSIVLNKTSSLQNKIQYFQIFNTLEDLEFISRLSDNAFEKLINVIALSKPYILDAGRMCFRFDGVSFRKEHYQYILSKILRSQVSQNFHPQMLAIYIEFLIWERHSQRYLSHHQFLSMLEEMLKTQERDIQSVLMDLRETVGRLIRAAIPPDIQCIQKRIRDTQNENKSQLANDIAQLNQMLLAHWERENLIADGARELIMAAMMRDNEGFSETQAPCLKPIQNPAIPLHEDSEVIACLGSNAMQKIWVAKEQTTSAFLWLNEIVKNAKEAEATEINFEIFLDGSDICIVVKDNGTGIPQSHLWALKTPGRTTKHSSGDDPNFGCGFFSLVKHFNEVRVQTRAKDDQGSDLIFTCQDRSVMIQQEADPGIDERGTTLYLKKKNVENPLLMLIRLKSELISRCQYYRDIDVQWQRKTIHIRTNIEPIAYAKEPYIPEGKYKGDIEVRLSKNGHSGIYCKNLRMSSLNIKYFSALPRNLIIYFQQEQIRLAIFLPPQDQLMNREYVVESPSLQASIQLALIKACYQFCLREWENGRLFQLLPDDFFYDFRSISYRHDEATLHLIHDWNYPRSLSEIKLPEQDKWVQILERKFAEDSSYRLLHELSIRETFSRLALQAYENQQKEWVSHLENHRKDSRFFWNLLIQLSSNSYNLSLVDVKEAFKAKLQEKKLISSDGSYFSFSQSELIKAASILEDVRKECNSSIPKGIIDQFLKSVMSRIHVHVKENQFLDVKKGPASNSLSTFLKEVALKTWNRKIEIQFYRKVDGRKAYVNLWEDSTIHINLNSSAFHQFNQFYSDCQKLGFAKSVKKNGDCILENLENLCHELAHLDEKSPCGQTHDESFYRLVAEKMEQLFIRSDREINVLKILESSLG
jgi:anti-sigma regulatory factor (Ser/Thr protein kinase)